MVLCWHETNENGVLFMHLINSQSDWNHHKVCTLHCNVILSLWIVIIHAWMLQNYVMIHYITFHHVNFKFKSSFSFFVKWNTFIFSDKTKVARTQNKRIRKLSWENMVEPQYPKGVHNLIWERFIHPCAITTSLSKSRYTYSPLYSHHNTYLPLAAGKKANPPPNKLHIPIHTYSHS